MIRNALLQNENVHSRIRNAHFRNENVHPEIGDALFRDRNVHSEIRDALFRDENAYPEIEDTLFRDENVHPEIRNGLFRFGYGVFWEFLRGRSVMDAKVCSKNRVFDPGIGVSRLAALISDRFGGAREGHAGSGGWWEAGPDAVGAL